MSKEMSSNHVDRILVVDDTAANLQLLTNLLTEHGYTVHPASDGELALRFVQSIQPDIILLDVKMPGMDGYEVCRRLKADERTRSIPIIFISILENEGDMVNGFRAGAVDYITKPFQPEEVLARVKTHLRLRKLTENLEQQVAGRTEELHAANTKLQRELAERKQTEEALKGSNLLLEQSSRFTEALLSAIPTPVFYKDKEGRYLGCNHAYFEMVGDTSEEIRGKTVDELWPSENAKTYHTKDLELMRNPARQVYEFKMRDKYGVDRPVIFIKNVFCDEKDQVAGIIGVFLDITERKAAEEALRKLNTELDRRVLERTAELEATNKELNAFAYTVSHDLRAPLRHIDGFLELLKKKAGTALDQQSQHYMDTISGAANKMGLLIDDLLSFSRMGRHTLSFQPLDLGALVREVILELEPDATGRDIDWCIGDLPAVDGDAAMLRLVLANLIANALKFTRPQQQARIEIGSLPGKNAKAVIFVRDNGVGFDMAYVDKLFRVFQRLHRTDEFEGTGIGLANVHRIIARHGGRTWAEGQLNRGASFFFSLPQVSQGEKDGEAI